jgi:hypothetical protein
MAEESHVRIFSADIIYHLFDQFTAFMNGLREVSITFIHSFIHYCITLILTITLITFLTLLTFLTFLTFLFIPIHSYSSPRSRRPKQWMWWSSRAC